MNAPPTALLAERRVFERRVLRTMVRMVFPGLPPVEGRSFDISVGGVGVVTHVNLKSGVWCRVIFTLVPPSGPPLSIDTPACVTHAILSRDHDGYKVGVQFKELPDSIRLAILRYLRA